MPWDYILSVIGLAGFYFAGKKKWWCWYINVINQIFWAIYSITTEQYGFMLATIIYFGLFSKNAFEWTRDRFFPSPSKVFGGLRLDPIGRVTEVKKDADGITAHFVINDAGILKQLGVGENDSFSLPPEEYSYLKPCKAVIDGTVCGRDSCAAIHMIKDGHDFVS